MKIAVTGGCGYIGAHTLTDLIENGFEVISIDDNSRSKPDILHGVEKITGIKVRNYKVNLCDFAATRALFAQNPDLGGIIHFAAYKSVPESVAHPLRYYRNNIASLVNVLECAKQFGITGFVFSSSCSVYGNVEKLPVTEQTPLQPAESPYANTKQMGEDIVRHFAKANPGIQNMLLRYFNPVGAHPSALIGEVQETPENLVPVITQTAAGVRPGFTVFGSDYPTRDGSCIRDYIHVSDIAHAHTLALQYLIAKQTGENCEVFNLGSGNGVTVLEAIAAFEKVSGIRPNHTLGERRQGDVVQIYANNDKARKTLGWQPQYDIDDMMRTAWKWEQRLRNIG